MRWIGRLQSTRYWLALRVFLKNIPKVLFGSVLQPLGRAPLNHVDSETAPVQ